MIPVTTFAGKRVAVFGLGSSGLLAARAMKEGGADVVAFDDEQKKISDARAAGLKTQNLREIDWSVIAALVLAPGVPLTHPEPHWTVNLARKANVEVIGDIELFCRERAKSGRACPLIAITGTNGKSTTTALIAHLINSAGRDAQMGGNIGVPVLALQLFGPARAYVLEVSSYQIDLAPSLRPTVGVLLNVTEDHIDRHGSIENYAAIKERLPANVETGGTAVIDVDDSYTLSAADRIERAGKNIVRVSVIAPLAEGYFADGSRIFRATDGNAEIVADLAGIGSLRGVHNAQNAACAIAACTALGIDDATVQKGLKGFPGLAHRMEQVGRKGNVLFVNDSKATNAELGGQGAGEFSGHLLDCRRKGENRWHRQPDRLFSAHPQSLSDWRGRERVCKDDGWASALRGQSGPPGRCQRCGARCAGVGVERAGGTIVACLCLIRPVPELRSTRQSLHRHRHGSGRDPGLNGMLSDR